MAACQRADCCELSPVGAGSPGTVVDNERLLRGAYVELHYNKAQSLKSSFPRQGDLAKGDLSVWRLDRGLAGDTVAGAQLVAANGPPGKTLNECIILEVGALRGIETDDGRRALCIKDDTVVDVHGNTHPEHAAIGLCLDLPANVYTVDSEELLYVVREITAYANAQRAKRMVC